METSKVPVEYSDPSNLFNLLKPTLESYLPLRNLHWNSVSRPLRSISSLHIDLIPDPKTTSSHPPTATNGESEKSTHVSVPQKEPTKKKRRHQIPGLRQTPYLKLYLVDCEDVDAYRATTRKELRDWIKEHGPASQSSTSVNKQENHDAFEWLIVHVTYATVEGANSSKPNSSARGDVEGARTPNNPRWSSRTSKTVIEKIRADFNGTSKNAVDRVSQVQVPEPVRESNDAEGKVQDGKSGWEDLVAKLKSLILASFDLRVQQYEEDIKEKELQRNLPGWNFNTFFILKEGLARGFESVGLVEDALTSYHELATSLGDIVEEQIRAQSSGQRTTRFVESTDDLQQAYTSAIASNQDIEEDPNTSIDLDLGASILDTERKPFRDLILANDISIFDFQNYVFARQVSLLLRLANAQSPKWSETDTSTSKPGFKAILNPFTKPNDVEDENLSILADVCRLSLDFIASSAWTIRQDIGASPTAEYKRRDGDSSSSELPQEEIVENIVASWTFSASHCILSATFAQSLSLQIDPPLRQLEENPHSEMGHPGNIEDTNDSIAQRNHFPHRTSSLSFRSPSTTTPAPREFSASVTSLGALRLFPPGTPHPGAQDLAAHRGDLLSLSRRSLTNLAYRCKGWKAGFNYVQKLSTQQDDSMEEIELSGDSGRQSPITCDASSPNLLAACSGIFNAVLKSGLQSKGRFSALYERLTRNALAHYVIGGRSKMAEAMTADLAVLCFNFKDYIAAASYFKQLSSFYNDKEWADLGITMLDMWAECLQKLGNVKEYIAIALKALACAADETRSSLSSLWSLNDLIISSVRADEEITVPLGEYFLRSELNPYISHYPDQDGFVTDLRLWSMLSETFNASSVRVKIVSVDDGQRNELWLSCGSTIFKTGLNKVDVSSNAMMPGLYVVDKIVIQAAKIIFVHDSFPGSDMLNLKDASSLANLQHHTPEQAQHLLVWTASQSFRANVKHAEKIDLSGSRSIVVTISSGRNNISNGTISLRAASAGLRLHTAKAQARAGECQIAASTKPGNVSFNALMANERLSINVPFSLESDPSEITIRVEVAYATEKGNFTYISNGTVAVGLPLAVNVQDTFKRNALFSSFTVGTANMTPIRILRAALRDSSDFITKSLSPKSETDVHVGQPLSLVAEVRHNSDRGGVEVKQHHSPARRLHLDIEYCPLDQEICRTVEAVLIDKLTSTPLQKFSCVLSQHLLHSLRSRFTLQDLEKIGLLREVNLGEYDQHGWESFLGSFRIAEAADLREWLRKWHRDSRIIPLDSVGGVLPVQHLTVPVDIPEIHVVHTACLRSFEGHLMPPLGTPYLAVGQALPLKLILEHTRQWGPEGRNEEELDFCYEIQASSDTWLVGGQRSARFSAKEGQQLSFSVFLLPQRTGHLLLPAIDIQPMTSHRRNSPNGGEASSPHSFISCETDFINQAETVVVTADLSSTTVSIDTSVSCGETSLVEATSRKG